MYPHAMDDDDGGGGGGCDGFFLACEEDLGEKFEKSFPASVFFFFFLNGDQFERINFTH